MSSGLETSPSAIPEPVESPTSARPRREGNDSLWKRARRTLGTQNLTFLQQTAKTPGSSTPGSGPAAPKTRREQVRHAQRTHRQRTQNYIKTLESEVVRLRESEANLMTERDGLKKDIQALRSTIISANLPLPPSIDDPQPASLAPAQSQFDMPATISFFSDDLAHERLHVSWPEPANHLQGYAQKPYNTPYDEQSSLSYKDLPDIPHDFDRLAVSDDPPVVSKRHAYAPPTDVKLASAIDTLETAIEFVLALEHPCMAHIPYPADTGGADPANHMMLLSTPLVARSPQSPKQNHNFAWTTSGAIIKELLNLSQGINLEGEITPVEAWHRLHAHPEFWRLDKAGIEALKRQLSAHVTCCGFGAVLDEAVFWHYLNQQLLATNETPIEGIGGGGLV